MMASQAVRLPGKLVSHAKKYGKISKRSVPMQLEYWAEIGKIAEENPDLNYSFIKNTLISLDEIKNGEVSECFSQEEVLKWQKKEVEKAKKSLAEGKSIPHKKFMNWARSLATDTPLSRPSLQI